ncbi:MAG: hypothetical protein JWP61_1579 [Friedmanniella sp.]|nr:hypothetical protein [Friedmanniella sp.]
MTTTPPAAPRTVEVPPERLAGWCTRFEDRHGPAEVTGTATAVRLSAADGATAEIAVPAPPLPPSDDPVGTLVRLTTEPHRVGAVLVRKGGYAIGLFAGDRLLASKVGSAYVQGRTKAGGWSQQRFARRRDNQSRQAYAEAADVAARVLLPHLGTLSAVVGGGDRAAVDAVLEDPRLIGLAALRRGPVLPTPDPRLRVLEAFPAQFRAVTITLNSLA